MNPEFMDWTFKTTAELDIMSEDDVFREYVRLAGLKKVIEDEQKFVLKYLGDREYKRMQEEYKCKNDAQ